MDMLYNKSLDKVENEAKSWGCSYIKRYYRNIGGGVLLFFKNGYALDIVLHDGSYGNESLLFELAIGIHEDCKVTKMCYSGPEVTHILPMYDSVIGYVDFEELEDYANKVRQLPSRY
ncbi:MAG: hypothetical protein VZS44_11515 [Bacilli bacterium]|nr:hypothetical protein [Bacilli bacterium]